MAKWLLHSGTERIIWWVRLASGVVCCLLSLPSSVHAEPLRLPTSQRIEKEKGKWNAAQVVKRMRLYLRILRSRNAVRALLRIRLLSSHIASPRCDRTSTSLLGFVSVSQTVKKCLRRQYGSLMNKRTGPRATPPAQHELHTAVQNRENHGQEMGSLLLNWVAIRQGRRLPMRPGHHNVPFLVGCA